jgi:hypothetical protein
LGADRHLVSGRVCVASRRTRPLASHPLKHCRWGDSWARLDEPELWHGRADDLGDMRRDEMGVVPLGHVRRGVAEVRRDRAPRPPIGAWHRCGSSPAASERSKPLDLGGPERLPSRRSHRISHRIPRYAVGRSGMNGRHNGHETSDFPYGATQKRTGRDERQRITKPLHCHCANPASARRGFYRITQRGAIPRVGGPLSPSAWSRFASDKPAGAIAQSRIGSGRLVASGHMAAMVACEST